jgi:hypothetical protein
MSNDSNASETSVYDVVVEYDGGDYVCDMNFLLTPRGGDRPVLRITTTALYTLGKGKVSTTGMATLNYSPSEILRWRVRAISQAGAGPHGQWTGLRGEDVGNWKSGDLPFFGQILSAGVVTRP